MSIRRTRQQKIEAELRRDGTALSWEPTKNASKAVTGPATKHKDPVHVKTTAFFLMDMQKTAVSTLIILVMLGITFWLLR